MSMRILDHVDDLFRIIFENRVVQRESRVRVVLNAEFLIGIEILEVTFLSRWMLGILRISEERGGAYSAIPNLTTVEINP